MGEASFDIKRLKAKHNEKELNEMFINVSNNIDTNHLPKLLKYLKLSRWNEFNTELEEFSKTVQPLQPFKLARHTDELTHLIESAIENMFFDVKEIKTAYCRFLREVRVLKQQMADTSTTKPSFSVIDTQLKEFSGTEDVQVSETQGANYVSPPEQENTTVAAPKTSLENNSASKSSQCCSSCSIF